MKMRQMIAIVAVLAAAMPLWAADKTDEEIRQEKEALFWASLSPTERAYQESLVGKAKPRMKAARLMAVDNTTATATEPSITVTEVKQREGTYGGGAIVDVTYNLLGSDSQCEVTAEMLENGVVVPSPSIDHGGDIGAGVQPGEGKHFSWNVGKDWPNGFSGKFQVRLTATETAIPASWATVTIAWQGYDGGKDVDICAFWEDQPGNKVGYDYISSSSGGYETLKWPSGDNTGTGPEQVYCDVAAHENKKLHIHFNYFGEVGSAAKVDVTVKTKGNAPASRIGLSTGTNKGRKATTSDPGIIIKFDASGKLESIDSI